MLKKLITLLFLSAVLVSCDNFQNRLYTEINLRDNGKNDTFNLDIITDFQWDKALFYEGNESVFIHKEFIEETLNDKKSKISWEDRRDGAVDETLKYKSNDIPSNTDRFYFLTSSNKLITKDIDHLAHNQGRYFKVINTSKDTSSKLNWILKEDCKIVCR